MSSEMTIEPDREAARVDEEDIRLATGFADIFTAIMLVVGYTAVGALAGPLGALIIPVAAFWLGKPLIRDRQFAATAIILALSVMIGAGGLLADKLGSAAFLVAALAGYFYWKIYKVPIALAGTWVAIIGFVATIGADDLSKARALVAGLALFALAMRYDSSDRTRETRRSDVAFWLHLAAAPLIVHGLFTAIGFEPFGGTMASPIPVFAVFTVLTIVALVVDRRPILVSSLSYLFAAIGKLLSDMDPTMDAGTRALNAALAPGVIGIGVLVLAAGWTPLRRQILKIMPDAIARHVPEAGVIRAPREDRATLPVAEAEPVRLVLGFNDLFVAIGCFALFAGCAVLGLRFAWVSEDEGFASLIQSFSSWRVWIPVLIPAAAMWLTAEYFVRKRRMAWPAITTALLFSIAITVGGWIAALRYGASTIDLTQAANATHAPELPKGVVPTAIVIACVIALCGNLLFWWRQRVPISFALGVGALVPLLFIDLWLSAFSGTFNFPELSVIHLRSALGGALLFAGAMWWDRSDKARETQRADTAFWLHMLAAALYVPALFGLAHGVPFAPLIIALGFVALVVLAVIIDRRGPLVIALPFVVGALAPSFGNSGSAIVGLAIAAMLLALTLKWEIARPYLLARLGLLFEKADAV